MEQIKRIEQMERYLNKGSEQVAQLKQFVQSFQQTQAELAQLFDYYGSEEWFRDKEDSDADRLPADLLCGVLGEDYVHDLFIEHRELAIELLELATTMLKSQ